MPEESICALLALNQQYLESSLYREVCSENLLALQLGKKCRHLKNGRKHFFKCSL